MWHLQAWSYPARVAFERDVQALRKHRAMVENGSLRDGGVSPPAVGRYFTSFKLHLASSSVEVSSSAPPLPAGLSKEVVVADYLRAMGVEILTHLQRKFGAHFTMEVIQWCITVPSIWDDSAKATMKLCLVAAGLVSCVGGSPHPLTVVLEPEAASFHC